ncbi:MAG: hypothetical protein CL917_04715 [Deltaproteobacteria bacterium]|nr:hypothetical protein [Deltaproteobacteria bacterium]
MQKRRLCLTWLFVWLFGVVHVAGAEEAPSAQDLQGRWIPSLTFDVLLSDWNETGTVDTFAQDCSVGIPVPNTNPVTYVCGPNLSGSASPEVSSVQYRVGLDLMTPRYQVGSMKLPRGWVFGGALINPIQSHPVVTRPEDGKFVPRMPEQLVDQGFDPPFKGVAAQTDSRYLESGWFVGVGSVFEVPYRDSMFRFKVGVNYMRERVAITSRMALVGYGFIPDPQNPGGGADGYFTVRSRLASENQTYHFLGPIGEAEMVLVSGARLGLSLYGQAQFLWNLDTSPLIRVVESEFPNGEIGTTTFTYQPKDFSVRGAIGVRLSWNAGFGF